MAIPGAQIQDNSISANKIVANTIVAGIVDGTLVEGASVVASNTGNGGGFFCYSGLPEAGNPPIFYVTNGTEDPYGNTVSAQMATSGLWITAYGNNSSSVQIQPSTTDFASLVFNSGFDDENQAGALISDIQTSPAEFTQLVLSGPSVTTYTDNAWVACNSQDTSGASDASVTLNATGQEGILTANKNGVTAAAFEDQNTYDVGERTLVLSSEITVTSTSGQQIFTTLDTGVGTYAYQMFLHCLQGSTAVAPGVDLGFGGTFAGGAGILESSTYGGATGEEIHLYPLTASTLSNELPAYTASVNFWIRATGTMTFSTTGAIAPFAYVGTSGDSWIIAEGSFFKLRPAQNP